MAEKEKRERQQSEAERQRGSRARRRKEGRLVEQSSDIDWAVREANNFCRVLISFVRKKS